MPQYVASRTLTEATRNATLIEGDLLLSGSGQLVSYLAAHDRIDEYRLMVHQIVLGDGTKRLFAGAPRRTLALADTLALPSGVVVNTYRPAAASAP